MAKHVMGFRFMHFILFDSILKNPILSNIMNRMHMYYIFIFKNLLVYIDQKMF